MGRSQMRYLLDTHIFLWWLSGDKKLNQKTVELIKNPQNQIFVSVASAWEISIKRKIGKISLKTTIEECFKTSSFMILDITLNHILELDTLPLHHSDPFDRILVAQARTENFTFVTDDVKIKKYELKIV